MTDTRSCSGPAAGAAGVPADVELGRWAVVAAVELGSGATAGGVAWLEGDGGEGPQPAAPQTSDAARKTVRSIGCPP
jgi:hypothetical protein